MKIKAIIETGNIDSHGNKINIEGINISKGNTNIITYNFDNSKIIGECNIFIEDNVVKCEADIPNKYLNFYPAIGFKSIESHYEGDILTHDKIEIVCGSLCTNFNADPEIKTIKAQVNQ